MRDFSAALASLGNAHLLRHRREVQGTQGPLLEVGGRELVAFASNDYLGLANHPLIVQAVVEAAKRYGVGACASHLISGHHAEHSRLEQELASFVGAERALYFSSGYMANTGVVPALVGRGDAVFSDALNHACLIDGARLSRAEVQVYPHADLAALEVALQRSAAAERLIISDTVFSMDGELAPITQLIALAERHDAMLLLDDAHGFGVLGAQGNGALAAVGAWSHHVLYMGTLGKAAGVSGAFVAGPAPIIEWLTQRARTYVFTTATPPMLAAGVRAALRVMRDESWRRERLRTHARRLRERLAGMAWPLLPSDSAIQPLLIGDSAAAMHVMEALWQRGYWVPAIRPPTVAEGSARLRISLSAAHTDAQVDGLADALLATAAEGIASMAAA